MTIKLLALLFTLLVAIAIPYSFASMPKQTEPDSLECDKGVIQGCSVTIKISKLYTQSPEGQCCPDCCIVRVKAIIDCGTSGLCMRTQIRCCGDTTAATFPCGGKTFNVSLTTGESGSWGASVDNGNCADIAVQ